MPSLIVDAAMVQPRKKKAWLNKWTPNDILNDEWVQIRNTTQQEVVLTGVDLYHLVYIGFGDAQEKKEALVMRLNGTLPKSMAIRIHSGKGKSWFDEKIKVIHAYANPEDSEFQYQITKPDCLILRTKGGRIDYAWYFPPLIEGKRVKRIENLDDHKMIHAVKKAE